MRTILAGTHVFRRAPLSVLPLALEGVIVAILVVAGVLPSRSGVVPAAAIFPLDVFFDLKHWLAEADGWVGFAAVISISLLVRGGVLAATFVLSGEAIATSRKVWVESVRLAAIAWVVFFPVAVLSFAGVAVRYAPFVWAAGGLGFVAALILLRIAIRLDGGDGPPEGRGLPEITAFMTYVWLVIAAGAAVAALGETLGAVLIALLGPLHALFLLGWRENARARVHAGGGMAVTIATVTAVFLLGSATVYHRYLRDAPPVPTARTPGTLLLLGGADSTSKTGALVDLEVRDVGYPSSRSLLLSYSPEGANYEASDTHVDLNEVARIVAEQVGSERTSRLLGHSQASLIVDRILDADLPAPGAAAVLAPAPPYPPRVDIPSPGMAGDGKVGGDATRALSRLFVIVGAGGFDVDASASPTNLEPLAVDGSPIPRLAVWALADAAWLDRDWRRPGEINVVSFSDHVGVTNDARALDTVRRFFEGRSIEGDHASWRGAVVVLIRYAFEPWRPE